MITFPKDFRFGTATASYQIEGAVQQDGRGRSIWDDFSDTPGKTYEGQTGAITNDHYNRYKEDIALMKEIGLDSYRLSIAWSRIFPDGKGQKEQRGIDFYRRLFTELRENDIRPYVTLYHWDLPSALQAKGGWNNRDTALHYVDYAQECFREFSDLVDVWMTFNEPLCIAFLGHAWGVHAPGHTSMQEAYTVLHHLYLAHGLTVRAFREQTKDSYIGIALNIMTPRPASDSPEDKQAAEIATAAHARLYLDPLCKKKYPENGIAPGVTIPIQDGDMDIIGTPFDFLGLNYYWEDLVQADDSAPMKFSTVKTERPKTAMGWDIVPEGLYNQLKWVYETYGISYLYVTENGAAFEDVVLHDGKIHDKNRTAYLEGHLGAIAKAINDGIPVKGYFLWSFIDNFEWSFGYTKRFGIVRCDYDTQKRSIKDSGYWYRDLIAANKG